MTSPEQRLKFLYRVIDKRAGIDQPPLLAVSIHHGVVPRDTLTDDLPRAEDLSNYKVCDEGDIILNRMRAFQGAIGVSPIRGLVSPDYMVLRPHPTTEVRYLHHLFRSHWFIGQMSARLRGIGGTENGAVRTPRINPDDLGGIRITLPSLEEQRRIADFLDAETSRLDNLALARNRQLELLKERFLTLVLDTVRGATEPGPRKASGLGWLGTVPSSWPITPVNYGFEVLLGKMLNQERVNGAHLAQYLRNTNVQWDRITTDDLLLMDFPPEERSRYSLNPGDLLVCEGGEPGRAAIWDGRISEMYYQKALHRVRARSHASSPRWLFYCLRAATAQNVFAVEGNTTTIAHLTGEQLRAHRFPFPDREVQDRATEKLDADSRSQEQLEGLLSRQLSILSERRQALITAAVTGQFDVSTASGRNVTEGVTV
ncbi:restriction endonuclease subunit S [Streptomyces sp. NPDC048110]|uniref:restriction endonuclease subunit S n=1 Tax=Streptomyces sp. NPDC048110 TaxID=3155483 RepID=UPI0033D34CC1